MNKNSILRLITLILILLNMAAIFGFSAEKAETSKVTSKKVTESLLEITIPGFSQKPEAEKNEIVKKADSTVRTLAHFSEYTLLGFLFSLHLSLYKMNKIKKASLAFTGCTLYATLDEIHQIFVPGRSFQFTDILTDASGSLLGIFLLSLIFYLIKKLKKEPAVR